MGKESRGASPGHLEGDWEGRLQVTTSTFYGFPSLLLIKTLTGKKQAMKLHDSLYLRKLQDQHSAGRTAESYD